MYKEKSDSIKARDILPRVAALLGQSFEQEQGLGCGVGEPLVPSNRELSSKDSVLGTYQ